MRFADHEHGRDVPSDEFEARAEALRLELIEGQHELLTADHDVSLTLVGDDRDGCHEVVDLLNEWLDARLLRTEVLGERNELEAAHPFLRRYWTTRPRAGRIAANYGHWVFELIAARFRDEISRAELDRRIEEVRELEALLAADGTVIRKFWIHASRKELGKRLKKLARRGAGWKAAHLDRVIHENYDQLTAIGEEIVGRTDENHAPWLVVESSNDRHRDLVVMEAVRDALRAGPCTLPPRPEEPREIRPGGRLEGLDPKARLEPDDYKERLDAGQARLADLSFLAAEKGVATVLAFEGWDAAGKGGAIRRLTRAMAALNYRVVPIAAPSDEERAHHYLWRFWRHVPPRGRMVIFDRSWYGRVLVERVEGFAAEPAWRRSYDEINTFERQLADDGVLVLKFWLEIDADEQLARFRAREKIPYKRYKITDEDYRNRERWDDYAAAADEMIERTHTPHAPWRVVPALDKRFARIAVLEAVCDGLERALG